MTDKQIKEEIKHINTRNQEYIAENNKMTKKIIDGVDVSGCIFFEIHYLEDEDVEIKEFCRIIHCGCDSNPNCYYKQLQREHLFSRKEQECEKLKKTIKLQNEMQMEVCEEKNEEIEKLKTENEELKRQRQADKGLITTTCKMNYKLLQEHDKMENCLTEIKEMCNNNDELQGDFNVVDCDKYKLGKHNLANKILQKISEVEDVKSVL